MLSERTEILLVSVMKIAISSMHAGRLSTLCNAPKMVHAWQSEICNQHMTHSNRYHTTTSSAHDPDYLAGHRARRPMTVSSVIEIAPVKWKADDSQQVW